MKIVVTGAAGFIGMHLVEHLKSAGHEVTYAIDSLKPIYTPNLTKFRRIKLENLGIKIQEVDLEKISVQALTEKFLGSDIVVHLAAFAGVRQSALTPHEYSHSNLTAFANVLEAIRKSKPKLFLFASSSSVYGNSNSNEPQEEDSATGLNLASYYAATKWTNEILARSHARSYGMNSVALRFFTVYGSYGRPDMAYMTFLDKILNAQEIELYGENGGYRSFSHVFDVVKVISALIESETLLLKLNKSDSHFEALNIGNSETSSARGLINLLEEESRKKAAIKIVTRPPFDVNATHASMERTFTYIEKRKFAKLEQGISEFASWYLNDYLEQL
jgi:UDP-glucuronate 4-epimerase